MSYTRTTEDAINEKVVRASRADSGIRLRDQLEQQSELIDQLHSLVSDFEAALTPILRDEDTTRGEEGADVTPDLSMLQRQVMGHYHSLNLLGNRISTLRQRVTL